MVNGAGVNLAHAQGRAAAAAAAADAGVLVFALPRSVIYAFLQNAEC